MQSLINKFPIVEALLKSGRITQLQLEQAEIERQSSNEGIEKIILKLGFLNEDDIGPVLEKHFNVPYVDLNKIKISREILSLIPESVIKEYSVIPISEKNGELSVAMGLPSDVVVLDYLRLVTGYKIKVFIALKSSISQFLDNFYAADNMEQIIKKINLPKLDLTSEELLSSKLEELVKNSSIIQLVNGIMTQAVQARASDIHVEPQEKDLFIRYRIDGLLHTIAVLPKEVQNAMISRIKIMSEMDIAEKRLPQDGQIRLRVLGRDIDFRVSTLPGKYGEKVVVRVLDKSSFALGVEYLGFLPDIQSQFEEMLNAPSGIILVTGPTGSGKTSTLYAALNRLKSPGKNIITLEDPIEYELLSGRAKEAGITQVQIHSKSGLTFTTGLRACLRQDPNIILIGEIRDDETVRIAINAALMGHLVLSTIHTNDSASTVTRLLDMGIEPYLIASSMVGILAQRLIRVLCPSCREAYSLPKRTLERMKLLTKEQEQKVFYRPKGCEQCGYSGYRGRTGIFELLTMTDELRALILQRPMTSILRENTKKQGLITLREHGMRLVAQGITSVAEVLRTVPSEL